MQNQTTTPREHFWDGLRAFLMLLGIPYHVALSYQPGQDFIVHSGEGVLGFSQFAQAVHLFRMPAFFVIAGYFTLMLLAKRTPKVWLTGRYWRLGLPFITSIVTLVPIMNLTCELSNWPWPEALRSLRYNSLNSGGYWVRHLWFIVVLLYFCTAASFFASRIPAIKSGFLPQAMDAWGARHFLVTLLVLGCVIGAWEAFALEAFYKAGLATMVPQQVLRLDEVIIYAPWFLLGGVIARASLFLARVGVFQVSVALVAITSTTLWLCVHQDVSPMTERFIGAFASLSGTQMLISIARAVLDRPIPLVRKLTDASFVIYLFHLPLITLFVWLAQALAVPPVVKALGIMTLSFGLSYGIWLVIRRIRLLSFLYEGIRYSRP